jgi:hypothetical protein
MNKTWAFSQLPPTRQQPSDQRVAIINVAETTRLLCGKLRAFAAPLIGAGIAPQTAAESGVVQA